MVKGVGGREAGVGRERICQSKFACDQIMCGVIFVIFVVIFGSIFCVGIMQSIVYIVNF